MTIIELMIAMALSLFLVLAVVQGIQVIATTISDSRSLLEMSGRLRLVMQQLQEDLEGATSTSDYKVTLAEGRGYFEILEGGRSDADNNGNGVFDIVDPADSNGDGVADHLSTYRGDPDDILMFTTRRQNEPFLGRVPRGGVPVIESAYVAEVAYWTSIDDRNQNNAFDFSEELFLHRRTLLIRPDLNDENTGLIPGWIRPTIGPNPTPAALAGELTAAFQVLVAFQDIYDVSARVAISKSSANGVVVGLSANSLSDLSRRGSRFAHVSHLAGAQLNGGPYVLLPQSGSISYPIETPAPLGLLEGRHQIQGDYAGEDIAISNLIGFDVRVFDEGAPIRALRGADGIWGTNNTVAEAGSADDEIITPGDPAWFQATTSTDIGTGAYVDMNYMRQPVGGAVSPIPGSPFSGLPANNGNPPMTYRFLGVNPDAVSQQFTYYDQWLIDNEADGFDQDADGLADEGTNGVDDNSSGGVDDPSENETSAPYPIKLRGVQVRVRVVDPDTRQLRQSTISVDFPK